MLLKGSLFSLLLLVLLKLVCCNAQNDTTAAPTTTSTTITSTKMPTSASTATPTPTPSRTPTSASTATPTTTPTTTPAATSSPPPFNAYNDTLDQPVLLNWQQTQVYILHDVDPTIGTTILLNVTNGDIFAYVSLSPYCGISQSRLLMNVPAGQQESVYLDSAYLSSLPNCSFKSSRVAMLSPLRILRRLHERIAKKFSSHIVSSNSIMKTQTSDVYLILVGGANVSSSGIVIAKPGHFLQTTTSTITTTKETTPTTTETTTATSPATSPTAGPINGCNDTLDEHVLLNWKQTQVYILHDVDPTIGTTIMLNVTKGDILAYVSLSPYCDISQSHFLMNVTAGQQESVYMDSADLNNLPNCPFKSSKVSISSSLMMFKRHKRTTRKSSSHIVSSNSIMKTQTSDVYLFLVGGANVSSSGIVVAKPGDFANSATTTSATTTTINANTTTTRTTTPSTSAFVTKTNAPSTTSQPQISNNQNQSETFHTNKNNPFRWNMPVKNISIGLSFIVQAKVGNISLHLTSCKTDNDGIFIVNVTNGDTQFVFVNGTYLEYIQAFTTAHCSNLRLGEQRDSATDLTALVIDVSSSGADDASGSLTAQGGKHPLQPSFVEPIPTSSPTSGLSGGAIAGIVIGSILLLVIVTATVAYLIWALRKPRNIESSHYVPETEFINYRVQEKSWE